MEQYTILILIFSILIFLLLFILCLVNNLLLKSKRVEFQFKNVFEYLEDRVALLNKVLVFVDGSANNEEKYMLDIRKTINMLKENKNSSREKLAVIKKTDKLINRFVDLVKVYPKFEKDKEYKKLIEELNLNKERVIYAMESYDDEAKKYNELKQTKINIIISKIFRIKDYEYYNK